MIKLVSRMLLGCFLAQSYLELMMELLNTNRHLAGLDIALYVTGATTVAAKILVKPILIHLLLTIVRVMEGPTEVLQYVLVVQM
jgi:hypothetical protein